MTVVAVHKDSVQLTMTLTAEFDATPERVWQLWEDPRQLERWWGPPMYPATFTRHELRAGGRVEYHMTGPDGGQPHGYWEVVEVEPPHRLVVRDGFAHADGTPNDALPAMTMRITIQAVGEGRTQMLLQSVFATQEAMEAVLAMGAEEGIRQAVEQIDAILAEGAVTPGR